MKITKCLHVTATEKKHLTAFLASGLTKAKVNTKHYDILSGTQLSDGYKYQIRITSPYTNDYGQKKYSHQTIEVEV